MSIEVVIAAPYHVKIKDTTHILTAEEARELRDKLSEVLGDVSRKTYWRYIEPNIYWWKPIEFGTGGITCGNGTDCTPTETLP